MSLLRETIARSSCTGRGRLAANSGRQLRFLNSSILNFVATRCLFSRREGFPRNRLAHLHSCTIYRGSLFRCTGRVSLNSELLLNGNRRVANNEAEPSIISSTFRTMVTTVCVSNNVNRTGGFILHFIRPCIRTGPSFGSCGAVLRRIIRGGRNRDLGCILIDRDNPSRSGRFGIRIRLGDGIVKTNINDDGGGTRRTTTGRTLRLVKV